MTIKTLDSSMLEKAQRRLVSLRSIDEALDLKPRLTVEAYNQLIRETHAKIEAHNALLSETLLSETLLSEIEEVRKTVTQLENVLADLSGRMLSGVASRYGKSSI